MDRSVSTVYAERDRSAAHANLGVQAVAGPRVRTHSEPADARGPAPQNERTSSRCMRLLSVDASVCDSLVAALLTARVVRALRTWSMPVFPGKSGADRAASAPSASAASAKTTLADESLIHSTCLGACSHANGEKAMSKTQLACFQYSERD
eukprot:6190348-Pleurochrysis_carterae.AAC.1